MTNTLNSKTVSQVLAKLFDEAEQSDSVIAERMAVEMRNRRVKLNNDSEMAELMDDAYIAVSPEMGKFLYLLARNGNSRNIVEFGTSFGISTIHLAAAVRDNDGGKVISTELNAGKAARAGTNLKDAGLADLVEIRQGDALETLKQIDFEIDLLLLDGWKNLYLPVLKLVEPYLRQDALVIADDLDIFPEAHEPYLNYIRQPENGYVSLEIPIGDRIELSIFNRN